MQELRSIGTTPSTVFQGFVASHLGLMALQPKQICAIRGIDLNET